MTKEEEFEELKKAAMKRYADYCEVIQKTSLHDLSNFYARRRLVDSFSQSVKANAAYRLFISKYIISPPENGG